MAGQLIFHFDLRRLHCMKLQDFFTTKTTRFQQQFHRRHRYRILVRRIEIEITTADQQVLRVGRLENDEPARLERAAGFVEKLYERLEWKMFGEVKRRHLIQACTGQRAQVTE